MTTVPAAPQSVSSPNASRPSRIVDGPIVHGFALSGVSTLPDPATHAYRKDLADAALAGQVIASHYAEPLMRQILANSPAYADPAADSEQVGTVKAGEIMRMLDCSRGWAWGYLPNGRVAYLRAAVVRV